MLQISKAGTFFCSPDCEVAKSHVRNSILGLELCFFIKVPVVDIIISFQRLVEDVF